MKKNRIYFGILVLVIMTVTAWAAYGMQNIGKEDKTYPVSVVVNNSNSDRWIAFKEGLEQGAEDYHIKLSVVSTSDFSDLEEESQTIRREFENGAKGVIVQPQSSEDAEGKMAEAATAGTVIFVETDMTPEDTHTVVMPDSYKIGQAIAEAFMEKENVDGKKIGILCGNQQQIAMQKRLEGFCDTIADTKVKINWILSKEQEDETHSIDIYQGKNPVDFLITLENDETEKAVDYLAGKGEVSCKIYGEGSSEKNVYYLDKGMIQTLIVPNEFNMGYQSVAAIAEQLEYGSASIENTEIGFLAVTKETLYQEENQKILFPIVQ